MRALVRVAVELEAERGDAGAGGAGEQVVAGEDVVQALLLDQVERDVEAHEEGTAGVKGELPLRWDFAVLTQSK